MSDYRLFRLDGANRIMGPAIEISVSDDDAAIVKAIEIDHADVIEIWSGPRFVRRVDPNR
jgi:hypothetical protein